MWSVSYGMLKRMGNYILPAMLRCLFISATLSFGNFLDLVKNRNGSATLMVSDVLFAGLSLLLKTAFAWSVMPFCRRFGDYEFY